MPKTLKPGDLLQVQCMAAGLGLGPGEASQDVSILKKGQVVTYVRLGRLIVETADGELLEVLVDNLGAVNTDDK